MKRIDLSGKKFGRLLVLRPLNKYRQGHLLWKCRCTCGNRLIATSQNIRSGVVKSCGCYRRDTSSIKFKKLDRLGRKNSRAIAAVKRVGKFYIPSNSRWYKRCAGRYYQAKKLGIRLGFASPHEFAAYCKGIAPAKCPVFGKRIRLSAGGFSPWSPSIDKIDPKKGYVRGNIQIISLRANLIKRDLSPSELMRFAHWALK